MQTLLDTPKNLILQELELVEREGINDLILFLKESDFFMAPASRMHHHSEAGGLAYHSLMVFRIFKHKNDLYHLGLDINTIRIASLLHDMCKINFYVMGKKWYKDATTDWRWAQRDTWLIEDSLPLGHGEKSIIMIQKYMQLTETEMYLIRFHMGAFGFNASDYTSKMSFQNAITKCPAIIAIASADWESLLLDLKD